jgi:hypothetical protein
VVGRSGDSASNDDVGVNEGLPCGLFQWRPDGDDIRNPIAQSGCRSSSFRHGTSHARQLHLFARQLYAADYDCRRHRRSTCALYERRAKRLRISEESSRRPAKKFCPIAIPETQPRCSVSPGGSRANLMSFSIPSAAEGTRCHSPNSAIRDCWGAQRGISMAQPKRLLFFTCSYRSMPKKASQRGVTVS